jgi:hypothetical protein
MQALKINVLHTGWLNRAKLPLSFANDREVLEAAFIGLGHPDPRKARIVRIQDTLHLSRLSISEGLLAQARKHPRIQVLGKPAEIAFDRHGNFR